MVEYFTGLKLTHRRVWVGIRRLSWASRHARGACLDLSPIAAYRAVQTLLGRELWEETRPSSGSRPARYRALLPARPEPRP